MCMVEMAALVFPAVVVCGVVHGADSTFSSICCCLIVVVVVVVVVVIVGILTR